MGTGSERDERIAAIKADTAQARTRGKRIGRPSTASPRALELIADLTAERQPQRVIAERLNALGLPTPSRSGRWTADRVKHVMKTSPYEQLLRQRRQGMIESSYSVVAHDPPRRGWEDGPPPLTWTVYRSARRLIVGDLPVAVVPVGIHRQIDPAISVVVRRALQRGEPAMVVGPDDESMFARSGEPTWTQYQLFAAALRETGVADAAECIRVQGIDAFNQVPEYRREVRAARARRAPTLTVAIDQMLDLALCMLTEEDLSQLSASSRRRKEELLDVLYGGDGHIAVWLESVRGRLLASKNRQMLVDALRRAAAGPTLDWL